MSYRKSLLAGSCLLTLAVAAPAFAQAGPPVNPAQAAQPSSTSTTSGAALGAAGDPTNGGINGPAQRGANTQAGTGQTDNGNVEGIVITGSRIRKTDFTSADPITVITAEQATLQGVTSTAELLQTSAVAASSFQTNTELTGFVTTGGPGAKTLNIRGLGAQRTLFLVDGARIGPAGTRGTVGPIDLTSIPESAIDHVDILKSGASSLYGSDAVAGVVNIITKRNQDGGEITVNGIVPQREGGESFRISGEYGKRFSWGYLNGSFEYLEQEPLRNKDRYNLNCAEDYVFSPTTGQRVDYTTPYANNGHNYKCYDAINNAVSTVNFGTVQYRDAGVVYPTAAQGNNVPASAANLLARAARAGYPLTYPYGNYISPFISNTTALSPEQHYSAFLNGGYNLTPDIQLYGQFQFNQRVSEQDGARQFFPTLGAAWVAGNPNNTFRQFGITPNQPITELPSNSYQTVNYYRGVGGVKGKITGLGYFDRFNFDVFGSYTLSDATYKQDIIYADRVNATTTTAAGCIPNGINNSNPPLVNVSNYSCSTLPASGIPWLDPRILTGNYTQAERNFLFGREGGSTQYEQYYVDGSINGDLFTLPAGPVGAALGFSYRHEHIDDTPDRDLILNNLWGQTSAGRTVGSDAVKEVYGEIDIPIIKNFPLIQNLEVDVSGRYSDYDSYGSNDTYKINLDWQVIPDIRIRGTIGTSYRAPALYEQYLANQTAFTGQANIDPCVNYQNSSNAVLQANCAKAGVPTNYTGASPNGGGGSALVVTGGGRGILGAETSQAKTIGVVFTPKFIKDYANINLAVDYYTYEVANEVAQFGSANILNQCYTRPDYPNNPYCTLFTRDTNAASPSYLNILTVNNSYLNLSQQVVRGISATLLVNHDFGNYGVLTFLSNLEWQLHNTTQILPSIAPTNQLGSTFNFSGPDFTGNASLRYDKGPISLSWSTLVLGKGSDTELFGTDIVASTRYLDLVATPTATSVNVRYKRYTEFKAYHDISIRYRSEAYKADLVVGIRNLFDEMPPNQTTGQFRRGIEALNAYDLIGRRFFVTATKRF